MLIKCPECELQVSDKAISCPHCGYPLDSSSKKSVKRGSAKRKRLPNGFGQISELKDKRLRKPFRAMVAVGKKENGRPIVKPLKPESFFETYNDAYQALMEYNKNPYDLDDDITIEQLYERWSKEYFKSLSSDSSIRTITSAWNYCSSLYKMRVKDVKAHHIKGLIENNLDKQPSAHTKSRIKSLFNLMLDYANEHDLVTKNYARTFEISDDIIKEYEESKRSHIPFSDAEISTLWANLDKIPNVELVIFQCYSGWRPQEIGLLEVKNVDIKNWLIVGGIKTKAGKMRTVPVHSAIRPIVKKYYDEAIRSNTQYLFTCTDGTTHKKNQKLTYDKYRNRFKRVMEALELNPEHKAHDPRMHFVTQCKKYKVDDFAIKYMVGHKISDVTEAVYTKRENSWLSEEIEKIIVNKKD